MTGRFQSFASLGLLSVLAAGFGLWSAFSGPQIASVQLHVAAANTLSASGFVETFQSTPTATATKSSGPATTIDYQAPDRFAVVGSYDVNGSKVPIELRMTQIGSACWQEPAADDPAAPSVQGVCAQSGSSQFLSVLQDLQHVSNVTLRGGIYTLAQEDIPRFVKDIFGPFARLFKGQAVEVRTDGSYISWFHLLLAVESRPTAGEPSESIVIRFMDVGAAPPVVRPAAEPGSTATTVPSTTGSTATPPTFVPPSTSTASTPTTLGG